MKTRNLLLAIVMLFFMSPSFGQKLKDKKIAIKYVALPSEKLPDDFKTYSVNLYGRGISTAGLSEETLEKSIKMDGFKRLDGTGTNFGHLRVSGYAGYVSSGSGKPTSKTTTKKDKEGKETKKTSYWYEVTFSMYYSYQIVDPEGNVLASTSQTFKKTVSTTSSASSTQARKKYVDSRPKLRKKFAATAVREMVNAAQNSLKSKFDYSFAKAVPQFYLIKKDKSADGFEKAFEEAKAVFEKAKATMSRDEIKEQLIPAMRFWVEQGDVDSGGDKKLKRIYKAANYNLAITNFYLNNFDAAILYADLVIKSEGKDRRSKNLLEKIEKTKKSMAFHGVNSLHFKRDIADAIGPAKVKAFEEEKEELAAENNASGGMIILNGEQIQGSVMQDKTAERMIFGENGNISFMVEENGEMKDYDLTSNEVSAFTIGDRVFTKMNFSPCAKGKEDAKMHILEELYISDKINLYQYYPVTGALADTKTEFAFQKNGEESPTSLMDTQFLIFKKGMAKYFSDCEDLVTMCSEGDIKMNQDDLVKAARIYSELCE